MPKTVDVNFKSQSSSQRSKTQRILAMSLLMLLSGLPLTNAFAGGAIHPGYDFQIQQPKMIASQIEWWNPGPLSAADSLHIIIRQQDFVQVRKYLIHNMAHEHGYWVVLKDTIIMTQENIGEKKLQSLYAGSEPWSKMIETATSKGRKEMTPGTPGEAKLENTGTGGPNPED